MISPLRQSDEVSVREWAREFLRFSLQRRTAAFGQALDEAALDEHIDKNELESALWHDIVHADYAEGEYVGVARRGNQPLGLVLVTCRIEPWLRVTVGMLRWIYVIPQERRKGVARNLVDAATAWMQERGIEVREAAVPADSSARALYEAAGFKATDLHLAAPVAR